MPKPEKLTNGRKVAISYGHEQHPGQSGEVIDSRTEEDGWTMYKVRIVHETWISDDQVKPLDPK